MLSVFSNHQPLHALAVLLNEIFSFPESTYADRIGNVVDVIFALVSEREGLVANTSDETGIRTRALVKGGGEVWKYLRQLRARAWRKKGWDPTISITRDEATRLCRDWFVDEARGAQRMDDPPSASEQQSSTTRQEASDLPLMGSLEDVYWYSGDLDIPDFAKMDEISLDNL